MLRAAKKRLQYPLGDQTLSHEMGRKPTKNINLPPRMRARIQKSGKLFYYYDCGGKPRKEIPLGSEYTEAIRKWSALESEEKTSFISFKYAADRYSKEVIPTKAARTQKDNKIELEWLLKFFNNPPAPLDAIKPINIRQYLDWRGKQAKTRANREKALFSHIWNKSREWGLTDKPNPCAGVKGFSEESRDVYVEEAVLNAVWEAADVPLREALDLAYLTGQRPADVLSMRMTDIRDGCLHVRQGKTDKMLRIEISGEFEDLLTRIQQRKALFKVHTLAIICNEHGRPVQTAALRFRFEKAREVAASKDAKLREEILKFQFRDLRAKAGTDKADAKGMMEAMRQLGHTSIKTTEIYVRSKKGEKVTPTR